MELEKDDSSDVAGQIGFRMAGLDTSQQANSIRYDAQNSTFLHVDLTRLGAFVFRQTTVNAQTTAGPLNAFNNGSDMHEVILAL
jgi:hypothetical protein